MGRLSGKWMAWMAWMKAPWLRWEQYPWKSAHTLVPLLLGAFLIIVFLIWEMKGAKYPMFPARLKQNPRILAMTLVITFISGANFFAVLLFWPTQSFNVYGHDPAGVGLRGLPIGVGILTGAFVTLWLLSVFRGHNRELMIASSVLMTAGEHAVESSMCKIADFVQGIGSLAVARTDNLHVLWGLLVIAGLGIGGIVVPASIITTIICPDVSFSFPVQPSRGISFLFHRCSIMPKMNILICYQDLIATVAALTLAIRVIGGSIGYTTYYNVFIHKFIPNATKYIGGAMILELGITNATYITEAIVLTGASLIDELQVIPGIAGNATAHAIVVAAGQQAYAESYRYVYLASIAFGVVSIIASCFLGNIDQYMDDHVAVVM